MYFFVYCFIYRLQTANLAYLTYILNLRCNISIVPVEHIIIRT